MSLAGLHLLPALLLLLPVDFALAPVMFQGDPAY